MVCACAHGLELGRNPVGAHSVRPSPCGKSHCGIYDGGFGTVKTVPYRWTFNVRLRALPCLALQ